MRTAFILSAEPIAIRLIGLLLSLYISNSIAFGKQSVPAYTCYTAPSSNGARFHEANGQVTWTKPNQSLTWYGEFREVGELTIGIKGNCDQNAKLTVSIYPTLDRDHAIGTQHTNISSTGTDNFTLWDLGRFKIASPGYYAIELSIAEVSNEFNAQISSLELDGPASENTQFNLKERRNAASVHLSYPTQSVGNIEAFYCEATAIEDPIHTFYMACGWHRGYFGMQVNSPSERRIIFSVWDSGDEGIDRRKVKDENRVQLIAKGPDVYSGDFGNEGTGGHSHLKTMWKTGVPQQFLVTARPTDEKTTIFAGYWKSSDQQSWNLISAWQAPKEGKYLRGLHSFSENFVGANGDKPRKALFGNQWIKPVGKDWQEIVEAKFSHDPTGKEDRLDRSMGVEKNQFYLQHGGFTTGGMVAGYTKFGDPFQRRTTDDSPVKMNLPDWSK